MEKERSPTEWTEVIRQRKCATLRPYTAESLWCVKRHSQLKPVNDQFQRYEGVIRSETKRYIEQAHGPPHARSHRFQDSDSFPPQLKIEHRIHIHNGIQFPMLLACLTCGKKRSICAPCKDLVPEILLEKCSGHVKSLIQIQYNGLVDELRVWNVLLFLSCAIPWRGTRALEPGRQLFSSVGNVDQISARRHRYLYISSENRFAPCPSFLRSLSSSKRSLPKAATSHSRSFRSLHSFLIPYVDAP